MDSKNPKNERSEQFSRGLFEEKVSNAKSFSCSFCKKEFSSAQALGGHMNVHRRDRAKLRNSSPDDQISSLSLEVNSSLSQGFAEKELVILESSQEKRSDNIKGQCDFAVDHDQAGSSKGNHPNIEEFRLPRPLIQPADDQSSSETELDLELRLGREPPKGFF